MMDTGASGKNGGAAADLSVMIPCRNNERTIGRVIESVRGLAQQLVVIDSGSTDWTLEIVERARGWCELVVIRTHWRGYITTKQMGLRACSGGHVLLLDSDEPLDETMRGSVRDACERGVDAGTLNRVVEYRGRLLQHSWQPEWRLRFVKRALIDDGRARVEGINPHDHLEVDEGIGVERLKGVLIHDSFETFGEHFGKQLHLTKAHAEALYAQGRRTTRRRLVLSPLGAYGKQLVMKGSWRDGYAGWLAASTSAVGALMKHAMLLEMQNRER